MKEMMIFYKNFLQNALRPKIRKQHPGMLQSVGTRTSPQQSSNFLKNTTSARNGSATQLIAQSAQLTSISSPNWRNPFRGCVFRRSKSSEEKWFGWSIRTRRWTESKHFRVVGKRALDCTFFELEPTAHYIWDKCRCLSKTKFACFGFSHDKWKFLEKLPVTWGWNWIWLKHIENGTLLMVVAGV